LQTYRYLCIVLELPGQQDKNDRSSMTQLFEAIKQIAEDNPDGFTVRIPTLEYLTDGYIAAYLETQDCFGDAGLMKVLEHAAAHDNIVGGWRNNENKQYYFDSSKVFDNRDEAIKFGRENKQIAIFDMYAFREIRL
jgi:fructokinase